MLMTFLEQNWYFILAAVLSALILAVPELLGGRRLKVVSEVVLAMNREHAVVLDIRTVEEFDQAHIKGAKNIPLKDLANALMAPSKEVAAWRKKPMMVVCTSGQSAVSAVRTLQKKGFDAWVLQGGMREWYKQSMPTVTAMSKELNNKELKKGASNA